LDDVAITFTSDYTTLSRTRCRRACDFSVL